VPVARAVLAGVTGIDGAGKGYLAGGIADTLGWYGLNVALVNVDGWLNLPSVRFSRDDPAEHFYRHALRLDEMFDQLVLPLRDRRSHLVTVDVAEETATAFRPRTYAFEDVDVIVLEGIYLLKRAYQHHYDVSFWVDCSFETALRRALARGQEGRPPEETLRAYETIYFPAQRIHFERDDPRSAASLVIPNDGGPRNGPPIPPSLGSAPA